MNDLEIKKLLITRLVPLMNPEPSVQELFQKTVPELEEALEVFGRAQAEEQAKENVAAHTRELRRATKFDGAWVSVVRNVSLNGKRLTDSDANRQMMESLLQPHEQEEPTSAIYQTLALSFPTKFSWETPLRVQSDAERKAEFLVVCRRENLSECLANEQLHRDGASLDSWVGASVLERAAFHAEAQTARQKFLINASPATLKQEAKYETQKNREEFQRAEADRQHQVSSQQQSGMFPPLPATHAETGETIDARWLRKTSTINFELFKRLCKRHGSAAVTSRLRGEN
jgi:hypothetical protein